MVAASSPIIMGVHFGGVCVSMSRREPVLRGIWGGVRVCCMVKSVQLKTGEEKEKQQHTNQ